MVGVWFVAVQVAMAAPALAQQSRTEEIAAAQAAKAERVHPYEPTKVEQIFRRIELGVLDPPSWGLTYDTVYSGGGFTLGGQYRRFYADRSLWRARGLYSLKNYKLVELSTISPEHLGGRLNLTAAGGWRDATQVGFYGLGNDTVEDARANFHFHQTFAEGAAALRVLPWVPLTGLFGVEHYSFHPGQGSAPSIETVYTPETAPGLGVNPTFLHSGVDAGVDTRPYPGYARTGGFYGLAYHAYTDVDSTYSFDRLDLNLVQHIPVLRETWVVSLHGRVQSILGDDLVPYFLMPSLGGGRSLRAYSSWRFRDRHAMLATIEWRWIPNRVGMDMALFYDAGKVASRRGDLDFTNLRSNWGVGARFHALGTTVLRIEAARGSEGWNVIFGSTAAF